MPVLDSNFDSVACAGQVGRLRLQAEAHFARLATIRDRLDAGDPRGVTHLLGTLEEDADRTYSAVASRIESRVLASLLVAEAAAARRRGAALELDPSSRLGALPPRLGEAEIISIVGNLLRNALDAVASSPPRHRRVRLLLGADDECVRVRVRDWGCGLGAHTDVEILAHGFTTKTGHSGAGLTIVRELTTAAGGTLAVERLAVGTAFEVRMPSG